MTRDEDITVELPAEDTVPRCPDCLQEVMEAGPIPPTSAIGVLHASPDKCLRGAADAAGGFWAWCSSQRRLSFWPPVGADA